MHITSAGHVHGFVVREVGRPDIFEVYMPYCNPGWRVTRKAHHQLDEPKIKYTDDDLAKYTAYRLTGNP